MNSEKEILLSFQNEKLVDLVLDLLGRLNESEKNEFISKNIDTQLALNNIGEDDGLEYIKDVRKFCKDCLKGNYYLENSDDCHWDNNGDDDFENCEWSKLFTEYFNITLMYSRNNDYTIAFEAFELLMSCLHEAELDFEILGTEEPDQYIAVDWVDLYNQYYLCIKNCIPDKVKMTEKAFDVWLNHGSECTYAMINNLEDIPLIEKVIRKTVDGIPGEWSMQHLCFQLLKEFNEKYNPQFNKVELARSFLNYNVNFYNDISKEFFELRKCEEAIIIIKEALEKVNVEEVKFSLKSRLIDCYENLNNFEEAFNTIYALFKSKPSYELYKRSRYFSEKINKLNSFIYEAIRFLELQTAYDSNSVLVKVLSYEGLIDELLDFLKTYTGYSRYDYLKYTSKALIYRVLLEQKINLANLTEYINSTLSCNIQGIVDLKILDDDANNIDNYLKSAVNILKEMVKFHVAAASRSRYERAAYYCGIIKDIFCFFNTESFFLAYYRNLINENSRRPALKDEMKKKIGYI